MTFSLGDYDCVGFDLDHTLWAYRRGPLSDLIHGALASFLVHERGYPRTLLSDPLDHSFSQKGLVLDKGRGNILKLDSGYGITRATHGTRVMSRREVEGVYGVSRVWEASKGVPSLLVKAGATLEPFYVFKDYFVTAGAFLCARIVDLLDEGNGGRVLGSYSFFDDYLDGLHYMYDRENFGNGRGGFFPELVAHPDRYFVPCSDRLKEWLRALREEGKTVFLVTSSNHDSAEFIAQFCLGKGWRDFFDLVVTFARKPGFFGKEDRPFYKANGGKEVVLPNSMGRHEVYTEGNFEGLRSACAAISGKEDPSMLYFGDSLIEDVYAASQIAGCDTVAIVEEISDEIESPVWGSFFGSSETPSLWAHLLSKHSRVAVRDLESFSGIGVRQSIPSFGSPSSGYFPFRPKALSS